MVSTKTSIKSLAAVALLSMAAFIAGCGGGGAVDPFAVPPAVVVPPTPPLVVNPGVLNAYAGIPVVVTISSGVGPFQVFTSDATVLPVTQVVAGAAITLTATNVDADRAVTLTVRDAAAQTVTVAVTVKATPLISVMTITPANASACGAFGASIGSVAICSGETATASLTLKGANALPIQNRQVRFDALQGPYSFALDQAATVFAKTITVLTDQNGQALVTIRSDAGVPTQVSLIRGTDLVSGNRVDASFTILQSTSGRPDYSVSPAKASITGYYINTCGAGSTSYQIYGGTAPYTVFANSIASVVLEVGVNRGQTVVVPTSGGAFNVITLGGSCAGTTTTLFTITDASGRVITATFDSIAGTVPIPVAPAPETLIVTPPDARIVCAPNSVVVFTISGGTQPYTVATDRPNGTTVNGGNITLTSSSTFGPGDVINVAISDAKSKTVAAKITCEGVVLPLNVPTISQNAVAGRCLASATFTVTNVSATDPRPVTGLTAAVVPASRASVGAITATTVTITPTAPGLAPGETVSVLVTDSFSRTGTGTLICR